jgi:hypothetical protein
VITTTHLLGLGARLGLANLDKSKLALLGSITSLYKTLLLLGSYMLLS